MKYSTPEFKITKFECDEFIVASATTEETESTSSVNDDLPQEEFCL